MSWNTSVPHVLTLEAPPPYPPRNAQAELHPEAPPPYPPQGKAGGVPASSMCPMTPAPGATASATPSGSGSAQLAVEVQHVLEEWLDTLTETYEGDWQPADPCDAPPWTCPIHAMSPDVLLEAQPPVFVAGFPCRPFSPVADAVPPADL